MAREPIGSNHSVVVDKDDNDDAVGLFAGLVGCSA